jgi:PAS domain S-box-containing protein
MRQAGTVSGRFLEDFLRALSRRRVDVTALLAGLPVDREELRQGHPQIEWDVFVEIMSRLEAQVGGVQGLRELGEDVTRSKPAPSLRRLAGLSASPVTLYRVAERWALRRAIPHLASRIELLRDGRLRVETVIPPPHRPCPQLLHVAVGTLKAAPRILGLSDAVVNAEVQPARAVYTLVLPSSGTMCARLGRAARALFSARAAFDQLEVQQGELQARFVELRAAYAVLEESEARHRALAEAVVDLLGEVSADGTIQFASPSVEAQLGFRPDEMVGQPYQSFAHPDDLPELEREVTRVLQGGRARRPVFRARCKDGGWRWVEVEAGSYRASDGEQRAVAILRDVGERIELEAERSLQRERLENEVERRTQQLERRNRELRELQSLLLQAERLGTAQDLAGRIAHSIHNPLGALIGHVQLALRDGGATEPRLERILELACRVRDVVQRTLQLYRDGKIDRAPHDPGAILAAVERELEGRATLAGVELRILPHGRLPRVEVDRELLVAALSAIGENAIQSMEGRPEAELRLGVRRGPGGKTIRFRVEDTGPGIPEELREKVFEPFFTTRRAGTGLGLAIARGVVQGHQGRLRVEDRPGGGTIVHVELPLR